jgi:group I intron endonuclease
MKTGVYKILNKIKGDFYIGSARHSFSKRKSAHFCQLKQNKHDNSKLQRAVNKYGLENFEFQILEECQPNLCLEREQYYIDILTPFYNTQLKVIESYTRNQKRNFITVCHPGRKLYCKGLCCSCYCKQWRKLNINDGYSKAREKSRIRIYKKRHEHVR